LSLLWSQGKEYEGPEDSAGDIAAEKEGYMIGNRVYLYFRNTTELSDWPRVNVSKWPNNPNGLKMTDGIGLLVSAKVFIEDDGNAATLDTIPLTELSDIYTKDHHTLYYLQTSYREEMDRDPTGTVEWGFYPVFGYFNETGEYPALSNIENSWPIGGWPSTGFEFKWPGEWNGRFGRGVIYADQECYYVVNDAQDQENLGGEDDVKYFPRPDHYVGDLKPDVTIQSGVPWGGIGVRVAVRGFQWNNPQARDAIFWEYSVANISDYDLRDVAFGYWLDNSIGGDGDDDLGFFNKDVDMAYSWDINGIGAGEFRPSEWELPLILRIGIALKPIVSNFTNVTIAADALHPNNNSESINLGCSMDNTIPGFGVFSLRGGVKALYMDSSQYGFTGGLGIKMYYLGNRSLSIDYAYKTIGILGDIHVYTVGISF
jgi:hypothetical protein